MIEFRDVTIKRGEKIILSNVTFALKQGGKCVITGSSGCGKTSLLLSVIGFSSIINGEIFVNGIKISEDNIHAVRSSIAYISQEPVLGSETVMKALMFPFEFKANKALKPSTDKVKGYLKKFDLESSILDRRCADISGGEKQRIVIARAMMMNKTIFLVDEATTGLDELNSSIVSEAFSHPDITVLSVSHDAEWISRQPQTYKIEDGKLLKIKEKL